MGRNTHLTPEVHQAIIDNLRAGCFKKHAANAAGVSDRLLRSWLERGATGEQPYAKLLEDVDEAVALDALRNQAVISQAAVGKAKGDWKAAAWNLERKFPRLYGRLAELEQMPREERPVSPWVKPSVPPEPARDPKARH